MEFLLAELTGKRPLLPPNLPMNAEVAGECAPGWRGVGWAATRPSLLLRLPEVGGVGGRLRLPTDVPA